MRTQLRAGMCAYIASAVHVSRVSSCMCSNRISHAGTVQGAAEMVLNDGGDLRHPGVLKDQVTSPAGTTITALAVLEEEGVRSAFIKAVMAASEQSKAMAAAR